MGDEWSRRGQELEETGCRETDGDKEMQNERGTPWGEQTQRLEGWKAAELTDRDKTVRKSMKEKRRSIRYLCHITAGQKTACTDPSSECACNHLPLPTSKAKYSPISLCVNTCLFIFRKHHLKNA